MSDLADSLQIDTPENVLLDAEIAGFGSRCVAAMIDYTILIILVLIMTYIFARATARSGNGQYVLLAWSSLVFILIVFYHLFFEFLWNGQTPGKRLFGLRVVMTTGLPVTTSAAIIRNLLRLFDFFPALYGVGLVVMFATSHTQRLGDLAARTYVIREHKKITLDAVRGSTKVTYYHIQPGDALPSTVRVDTLNEMDRQDVIDYLQRRAMLHRREYVVVLLARRIAEKVGPDALADVSRSPRDAERFLEQIALAFERQHAAVSQPD